MNQEIVISDLLQRLKLYYLPELKTLHQDCIWLSTKLGLSEKKELQSSETRLVQFISVVTVVIKQIEEYTLADALKDNGRNILAMEGKISKTILPVKARLLAKLDEARSSDIVNKTTTKKLDSKVDSKIDMKVNNNIDNRKVDSKLDGKLDRKLDSFNEISSEEKQTLTPTVKPVDKIIIKSEPVVSDEIVSNNLKRFREDANKQLEKQIVKPLVKANNKQSNKISNKLNLNNYPANYSTNLTNHTTIELSNQLINQTTNSLSNQSTIYYSSANDPTINQTITNLSNNSISIEDEFVSSRRRRRLNHIVPNPRKPRSAEYNCSNCNEVYTCIVNENPWWAVYHHECPKCKTVQVPRIDISLNSNSVENDPNVIALYGEGIDDSDNEIDDSSSIVDSENSDCSDIENNDINDGNPNLDDDTIENDEKPFDGEGLLAQEEASKLLVLMCHARSCTGYHALPKHAEICRSTKFLMLHIRDCNGHDVLNSQKPCQLPWCLPCKKMLRHLTRCYNPNNCSVCNPWTLPESYQQLRALNQMNFLPVS